MNAEQQALIDANGNPVAQVRVCGEADGWFTGELLSQDFPQRLQEALAWYDEVVENQMLSYLDQATAAVEQFGLRSRHADGSTQPVFALHITRQNEVSFRTTPVPPPAWSAKRESA
jgi:hypothetical protein